MVTPETLTDEMVTALMRELSVLRWTSSASEWLRIADLRGDCRYVIGQRLGPAGFKAAARQRICDAINARSNP